MSRAMATLYDEVLLDHIKNARNYQVPERVSREISGSNMLCGDEIVLYLSVDAGRMEDIGFQCACCGISMASASIMTEMVKGRSIGEVRILLREFTDRLGGKRPTDETTMTQEQQALLDAARKSPARAGCAALPWTTLMTALAQRDGRTP